MTLTLACVFPKATRVNVRCMPHSAVFFFYYVQAVGWGWGGLLILGALWEIRWVSRYCVWFNIYLSLRDVALSPTAPDGQVLYSRRLSVPMVRHHNKISSVKEKQVWHSYDVRSRDQKWSSWHQNEQASIMHQPILHLVCAIWHNALLQQMGRYCVSDNCRFPLWAITIRFVLKKKSLTRVQTR